MENNSKTGDRVSGLDSIRFICAMVVFFCHGAAPPLLQLVAHKGVFDNLWNGPAAVVVFFVVSGFCIHYPFAGGMKQPRLGEFYSRRFLRLCIPAAAAIPLSQLVGYDLALFHESILWSLGAELFYYLIYPVIRKVQLSARSWTPIIAVAYGLSVAVMLTNPRAIGYASFGALTPVVGLPCWILGCAVAEVVRGKSMPRVTAGSIWAWRCAVVCAIWACRAVRFHYQIGYAWSLNVFALLAAVWLIREISFRRSSPPSRLLESAGAWSYSLYLLHPAIILLFERLFPSVPNVWLRWVMLCGFGFAICYSFYLLVERPSHGLARAVARRFRADPPAAGSSAQKPAEDWKLKAEVPV